MKRSKEIAITVYLRPGTRWRVSAEQGGNDNGFPEFEADELGEAVKIAVTRKFIQMAIDKMGEPNE